MRTLIVGGGLSGLALARMLEARGDDYLLIEARSRFGGRIKTAHHAGAAFDLGPTWFWPAQPRIAALIDALGLEKFDQFATGALSFEDETGRVQRGRGHASMEGSWRLKGGLSALTDAVANALPNARKRLNAPATALTCSGNRIIVTLQSGEMLQADHVVIALPPRIAASLKFAPTLSNVSVAAMQDIATWMAGQAKAVAVYDRPFWREDGLSGDAMSRCGPMVEIHDASPARGGPYALFGFIGIPPDGRADEPALRRAIVTQLARLFGPEAAKPNQLFLKDWVFDNLTSTLADKAPLFAHPTYGLPDALTGLWDGRLHFAGTEVASDFGGYLEGALEAAEVIFALLEGPPQPNLGE